MKDAKYTKGKESLDFIGFFFVTFVYFVFEKSCVFKSAGTIMIC
jgi:hypothetical protein